MIACCSNRPLNRECLGKLLQVSDLCVDIEKALIAALIMASRITIDTEQVDVKQSDRVQRVSIIPQDFSITLC